jgi:iron-sulfur cluster repair protein YtfE (RIC family)
VLINIGASPEPSDIVGMLAACHDRIRSFIALARRLAETQGVSPEEVRDASERIVRYFSESLPLHVADEEQSVIPRLSGRTAELDESLETMHREHQMHDPQLQSLIQICRSLHSDPARIAEARETLRLVSTALERDLLSHLQEEERTVLPAIRTLLTNSEQNAMLDELRDRRSR